MQETEIILAKRASGAHLDTSPFHKYADAIVILDESNFNSAHATKYWAKIGLRILYWSGVHHRFALLTMDGSSIIPDAVNT